MPIWNGKSDLFLNNILFQSTRKMITRDEWERKLKEVKIRKEDMNRLIMNFLVTEGYVDAADKFRLESGTQRIFFSFFSYTSTDSFSILGLFHVHLSKLQNL